VEGAENDADASTKFPILVEDMTFTRLLHICLKLMSNFPSNFPHVQMVGFPL
jgi:Ca2+-dependent lipid-binding protein